MTRPNYSLHLVFSIVQLTLLGLVILSMPTTPRVVFDRWSFEPQEVFIEYRAVVMFLPDLVLSGFLIISLARVFLDPIFWNSFRAFWAEIKVNLWGWLLLIAWSLFGMMWAKAPILVLDNAFHLLTALATAVLVAWYIRNEFAKLILAMSFMGPGIHASIAILQFLRRDTLGLEYLGELTWPNTHMASLGDISNFRAYGLAMHPNNLAGYLLVGWIAIILFVYISSTRTEYILSGIFALGIGLGILVTISRVAMVGAMLILIAAIVHFPLLSRRFSKLSILLASTLFLMFVVACMRFVPEFQLRLMGLLAKAGVLNRIFFGFPQTIAVIQQFPVWGVGASNLMLHFPILDYQPHNLPAHNVYVFVWAELGLPGFMFFISIVLSVLFTYFSAKYTSPPAMVSSISILILFALMLFDYYYWRDFRDRLAFFWGIGLMWGMLYSKVENKALPILQMN